VKVIERGGAPITPAPARDAKTELTEYISALASGSIDQRQLQRLALLCSEHPLRDLGSPMTSSGSAPLPMSPTPGAGLNSAHALLHSIWTEGRAFDRLFNGLMKFLDPSKVRNWRTVFDANAHRIAG
jgi:CLIP-associating protein 1/2